MLKISVIVPSFNQGKFLEETIISLLDQEYPELEIFIIDGGSTDNSPDIIKKYEDKLAGWIIEKDKGQSDAINKGFKMCTGEIVSWLCSDDLYTPGALKKVNESFSKLPPNIGLIHGNSEIFKGEKVIHYDKGYASWSVERQLAGMTFPQPSAFMRRKYLEQAGLLNITLHYGMDYDLFARLRMICDFYYEDFYFSKYRLHNESKSTTAIAKFIEEWIKVFNSIVDGLRIVDSKNILRNYDLKIEPDLSIKNYYHELSAKPVLEIDKLMFYFLVNVIRYDYGSENFARVRKIGSLLKKEFGDFLKSEPSVIEIINRSTIFPHLLLKLSRKLKRALSK